jgi:transcriptional regulator GlxA family with amidase domain
MPAGAAHGARFGSKGARIMIVRPRNRAGLLDRLVELRGVGLLWLAWRLAAELRATDTAAPLAAEGLALELLAATSRETTRPGRRSGRPPRWLRTAEEMLRARVDEHVGLSDLGEAVGVHPTHLARVFRAHHGVSVGEYGRRLRLARAATELAGTDIPLVVIARRAGFADQSHFTRLFRRHAGTTPARYRAETHSTLGTFQAP